MTTMRAVFWDFGGVFTPSPFGALRVWATERGLDAELVKRTIFGPYEQDTDHPWHQLERGETTLRDAMGRIAADAADRGIEVDPDNPLAVLAGGMAAEDRSAMVDSVWAVREAGLHTGLITNNVAEFGDGWRSLLPIDELFDTVIDSSSVGVRKPDPAIYRLAMARLEVEAVHTVFVDDLASNLDAAAALGMTTVLVPEANPMQAAEELLRLLGL
ncbi:MAG: HAD family phosphatase [Acidimicrobiia bacterium]|nr:HAD family phosphatase [Acidimicrobiia bacterium]